MSGGAFSCDVCGKALGARRVRQGIRLHPGCRRSLRPADLQAALGLAQGALARLPERTEDPELRELFAQAAAQARSLVGDLERLKTFVGSGESPHGDAPRGEAPRGEPPVKDGEAPRSDGGAPGSAAARATR